MSSSSLTAKHEYHTHPYLSYLRLYPLFISGISLFAIYDNFSSPRDIDYPNLLISIAGILGSLLYFLTKPIYKKFLNFWAVGQLIIFVIPLIKWEIKQPFNVSFVMQFELVSGGDFIIGINFIGFLFLFTNFYFNRLSYFFSLVGKEVVLSPIKPMANLKDMNHLLPVSGIIIKRIRIEKDDNWVILKLHEFQGVKVEEKYIALRSTDKETFKPGQNKLVKVLKLKDTLLADNERFKSLDFEFLGIAKGK